MVLFIMKWKNGNIYNGELVNGVRKGNGIMTWKNGDIYNGQWENNIQEGRVI